MLSLYTSRIYKNVSIARHSVNSYQFLRLRIFSFVLKMQPNNFLLHEASNLEDIPSFFYSQFKGDDRIDLPNIRMIV